MKKLTLLVCFAIFANASALFAQKQGKISGSLLDEKNQALPFANVLLLNAKDSTLVKGGISDEKGDFLLEQIAYNQYLVSVSSVGYQKYFSSKVTLSPENQSINLSAIQLSLGAKTLSQVTVTATKPFIEMQADKLVVNVENSISSTGSTAMEVLEKAPGVMIDQNDNISLKGKSGILIYMDGKPTYMSSSDLANLLKNMSSDQIEKIEIISNPSARYDASGKAVINIVTKKNRNFGTNGSINTGIAVGFAPTIVVGEKNGVVQYQALGQFPRYNSGLTINNRQGKFNLFSNFSFNDNRGANGNNFTRIVDGTRYNQYTNRRNASTNTSYKAGMDYFMNAKTTLGFLINGNTGSWQNPIPFVNTAYMKTLGNELLSSPVTTQSGFESWFGTTFNTNFKHTFDSTGKELTADLDYSIYRNFSKERGMTTHFYNAGGEEYGTPLKITSSIPNNYNIIAAKIDYVLPFTKSKSKLEIGAKSSWVKSDNDVTFYRNDTLDVGRTNHFIYTENINAIYGNYSKELSKKWNVQAGLRMEATSSEGKSLTLNQSLTRNYLNFFPSVFLKQTVNKNNQLAYSFSRRIERPDYESLNPFVGFLDPYTYFLGNEYLKPQYTNSFEVNHTFKQSFITTLGYSRTTDYMAFVNKNATDDPATFEKIKATNAGTGIDPSKITFATRENIALYENYNLGFNFPLNLAKWWTAQNNVSIFHNKYTGGDALPSLNGSKTAYNFNTNHTFTLEKTLSLEVSMWYSSANRYGQLISREQYAVNMGIKKSLWNKKADLKFSVNDIFATNHFYGTINDGTVNMVIDNHWTSRRVGLTFTYKFGNSNIKSSREHKTATEAEQNRVKSGG